MAGVDFEDAAQVGAFDLKHTSSIPEKEQALILRLGISSGHTIIDLGAGTGTFAIQAAITGASTHAVDISQAIQWLRGYLLTFSTRLNCRNRESYGKSDKVAERPACSNK